MMHLKKVFLLTLCSFISGFGAFEDPFEANEASKAFIASHPTFPAGNIMTVVSYKKGEQDLSMGSGVALNAHYILTSCHHTHILDADTSVWVSPSPSTIPIDLTNSNMDITKAKKDKTLYHCTNRYQFSKVTISEKHIPPLFSDGKENGLLKSFRQNLSTHDFIIRNGKHTINTLHDILLLKVENPLPNIAPITLSATPIDPPTVNVYGIASQGLWCFADGQKSMNGTTFMDRAPLPKIFEHPDHRLPSLVTQTRDSVCAHFRPQVFVQTLRTVPVKPKAFGCFEKLNPSDNESFKKESSLAFHTLSDEEKKLFGPCVGGTSGCPVFTKEDDKFSLFGLMSYSSNIRGKNVLSGEEEHFTLNVFQTLTPELVEKINKVMARPEPAAATAAEAKP
ncbi:MAG: hypothetical protein ACK5PQ_04930 [Alphaproteobacteria bacterium]